MFGWFRKSDEPKRKGSKVYTHIREDYSFEKPNVYNMLKEPRVTRILRVKVTDYDSLEFEIVLEKHSIKWLLEEETE